LDEGADQKKKLIIVDSNVVFRIIIGGSKSYPFKVIERFLDRLVLLSPDYMLHEFRVHMNEIKKKYSKKNVEAFEKRLLAVFSLINVLPYEFYEDKLNDAEKLASFDPKYSPFIALHLKLKELGIMAPIWTEDKKFLKASLLSGKFIVLDTKVVSEFLEGLELEGIINNMMRRL